MNTRLAPLLLLLAAAAPCTQATAPGATCACDLATLHPLQGALGYAQVEGDLQRIQADPAHQRRKLEQDPIKTVRAPGGALYITDHHHTAAAWQRFDPNLPALCQIDPLPPIATQAQFWSTLEARHLVHLEDPAGHPITPAQLPQSLQSMPDDPYRSLAGEIRWQGAWCRAAMPQPEFAEFTWADWLRTRPGLPKDPATLMTPKVIAQAITLARSPEAAHIPGHIGPQTSTNQCPREP